MRAIVCRGHGGPEVLQWTECPVPLVAPGEVLIKVKAAGLNRADIYQRQGRYPPPQGASALLGMECSGEIAAVGAGVKRWKVGAKVCALLAGGGYAEYVNVPEGQVLPVPDNVSLVDAAALPECLVTVWANVFETGAFKPHETILVHGGSSGIGTAAIQMVKIYGGSIIVTAGSDEKCDACRKLGADLVINYKTEDFVGIIERETDLGGVNVVLDMIGGEYLDKNLLVMAPFGRHISISTQQGPKAMLDLRIVMKKRLVLTGSTIRARPPEEKARLVKAIEEKVWPWVISGQYKPLIHKVFPIKEAAEAHKVMESSAHIGKMVLEVTS